MQVILNKELYKIINARTFAKVWNEMLKGGILSQILPFISKSLDGLNDLIILQDIETESGNQTDAFARLMLVLNADNLTVKNLNDYLTPSNQDKKLFNLYTYFVNNLQHSSKIGCIFIVNFCSEFRFYVLGWNPPW